MHTRPPTRWGTRALRALGYAAAIGLALVAAGLATGRLAPDAPRHLRLTVAVVLGLLAIYRVVQTRARRG